MEGCTPDLPNYVALFTSSRSLSFTKTPRGLANAYQDATKADKTATEKIFLDAGGFTTWFSYFLTERTVNSTNHFEGQAADRQLFDSLDTVSSEHRQLVARQVFKTGCRQIV